MEFINVLRIPGEKRGPYVFKGYDGNMYHKKDSTQNHDIIVWCQLWRKKDQQYKKPYPKE